MVSQGGASEPLPEAAPQVLGYRDFCNIFQQDTLRQKELAQGGDAHVCRGRKTQTGRGCGGSENSCDGHQVTSEEGAQGTGQSLARGTWRTCQA